jgi:hypothetical protein
MECVSFIGVRPVFLITSSQTGRGENSIADDVVFASCPATYWMLFVGENDNSEDRG